MWRHSHDHRQLGTTHILLRFIQHRNLHSKEQRLSKQFKKQIASLNTHTILCKHKFCTGYRDQNRGCGYANGNAHNRLMCAGGFSSIPSLTSETTTAAAHVVTATEVVYHSLMEQTFLKLC